MPTTGELYYQYFEAGYPYDQIAKIFGIKPASVRRMIDLYKQSFQNGPKKGEVEGAAMVIPKTPERFTAARFHGKTDPISNPLAKYEIPANRGVVENEPLVIDSENVLVMGDWHVPYHNTTMLARALYLIEHYYPHVKDIAICGDVFNFSAISSHAHTGQEMEPDAEVYLAGDVLRAVLHRRFKRAWINSGNHDERLAKKLDRQWGMQLLINAALGKNWPDCEIHVTDLDYVYIGENWQAIHPSRYSGQGGKTPAEIAELDHRNTIGLHNHIIGIQPSKSGRYIGIDTGHMTAPGMHYYVKRRKTTFTRWQSGFTIISNGYAELFTEAFTDWSKYGL